MTQKFSAIIVKGNPEYISGNELANSFYNEIKSFVEDLGFEANFFEGGPEEKPPGADLIIAHSLGVENLQFAPSYSRSIKLGTIDGIYHPLDNVHDEDDPPNEYHFKLTDEMKSTITDNANFIERLAVFQEQIIKLADKIQLCD